MTLTKRITLCVVGFGLWVGLLVLSGVEGWVISSVSAQENITITTYYPSPFGSYNELTVASRMAIGDVNNSGAVDVFDMAVDNTGNDLIGSLIIASSLGIGGLVGPAALANTPPSPLAMLHVQGRATADDAAIFMPGAGHTMRVGIGTATPIGDISFGGDEGRLITVNPPLINNSGSSLWIQAGAPRIGAGNPAVGGNLILSSGAVAYAGVAGSNIELRTSTPGDLLPTTKMVIRNDGNVGIGVTNPLRRLHIDSGGVAGVSVPAIQIVDGNQAEGSVLTSDINGVGTWRAGGGAIRVSEECYVNSNSGDVYADCGKHKVCFLTEVKVWGSGMGHLFVCGVSGSLDATWTLKANYLLGPGSSQTTCKALCLDW